MTASGQLPLEIISLIIDYITERDLYSCALLNRAFHIVANPILWRSPRLDTDLRTQQFHSGLRASKHYVAHQVRHLDLSMSYSYWTDDQLLRLLAHVHGLTTLKIPNSEHVTDAGIRHLPQQCPRLNTLIIGDCATVTTSSMAQRLAIARSSMSPALLANNNNPHHFAAPVPALSWRIFTILRGYSSLQTLVVDIDHLVGMSRLRIPEKAAQALTQLHQLRDLRIYNPNACFMSSLFSASAAAWPCLTCLFLVANLNDVWVKRVMANRMIQFLECHGGGLTHLGLFGMGMTDSMLDSIGANVSSTLTSLAISKNDGVTRDGIRRLALQCPALTHLQLEEKTEGDGIDMDGWEVAKDRLALKSGGMSRLFFTLYHSTIERIRLGN